MQLSDSNTEWVKFGNVKDITFVGKEYIAFGSGCHMMFAQVYTKQEYVYHAKGDDFGEGIGIIAGHKSLPFFAFSERRRFPRVFIMACPSFETLCILDKQTNEDYLAMGFSEGEFLVTLNANPSYEIIVWNWRNGLRVASMQTNAPGRHQIIRCNLSIPIYFAQLTVARKRLYLWDIAVCGRKCVLSPHKVSAPEKAANFSDILWTSEGALLVLDMKGHVYSLEKEYRLKQTLCWENNEEDEQTLTSFTWYKNGLLIAGPGGEVRHYSKIGDWINDWKADSQVQIKKVISNFKDTLIGVSSEEEIMTFNFVQTNFDYFKQYSSAFNDMCLIYPVGEYFVTLQYNREVISWELATGQLQNVYVLRHKALVIKENPEYPYVGIGYSNGILELLSVFDASSIQPMTYFNLSKRQINSIYFTKVGKLMVAADTDVGDFFVIEGIPGSQMTIIATLEVNAQICDYMLVASRTCMRLFAILVTSDVYVAGNKLVRYCIVRGEPACEVKEYALEYPELLFSKIYVTSRPNRDRIFHVVPLTAKCLFEITTKRGDPVARITDVLKTEHMMKKICLHTDLYHTITYAYDGLVIARSPDFGGEKLAVVMPHYRTLGGVVKAYIDPLSKYLVSLGRDNTLVCTSLTKIYIDEDKRQELRQLLSAPRMVLMFERKTGGFTPKGELADKTWKEYSLIEKTFAEHQLCKIERESILEEFASIKAEVAYLLTTNLEGPDNEKLDIQEFNLDVDLMEDKIKKSHDECLRTKVYLEALITAQDKVSQWIKSYCWDPMGHRGQSVRGIFSRQQVDNYILMPEEIDVPKNWYHVGEYRKLENRMAIEDSFQPWQPQSEKDLRIKIKVTPQLAELEQGANILDLLGEEEEEEVKKVDEDTFTAWRGTMTHLFIPLEEYHYDQQEISSFFQTQILTMYSLNERYKIKEFFNEKLTEMIGIKEREMSLILERNAKLRHFLSEYNYFSSDKIYIDIEDPTWHPTERPETILKVEENEVEVTPYISPSEQAILDAIAAEQERIRLLLLADNFRELALMEMMNGVLEVRWEDELRKDVPKPKCLLEKEPEEYNEDDFRAIIAYEEDVKFLNSERERYKKILEADYGRISNYMRDGVRKFNKRLSDFLIMKIQVDQSITQEHLLICRKRLFNSERMHRNILEKEIIASIKNNFIEIEAVHSLIATLNESLRELKALNETIQAKEKLLEKAFKKEFVDSTPVVQEQTFKLYKRRPKANIRQLTSLSLTLELAKCVASYERTILLTQDCLDYLKALDNLDMYIGIPPAVDETAYSAVCKHRRFKIENELRIKASQLEISEAEATISTFQKLLSSRKEMEHELIGRLDRLRKDMLENSQNMELQLVLRSGVVEVPQTGKICDFEGAVMINRKDVETINKIIIKGGQRKIKAMKETMNFRQGIVLMEWEHKRLRMKIDDLKTYLTDIDSINLTKDLQTYLKFKARGQVVDKLTFEEELEMVKASYQKIIDEKKFKVHELQRKINTLKKENQVLDDQIVGLNVDVCDFQLQRDYELEKKEKSIIKTRTACLLKRAKLVKQIQGNHSEILVLQTELELLRLKTYPTLSYTILQ